MTAIDPISLAQALIRCPSVTPRDAGALGVLENALKPLGFACARLAFGDGEARVENLYAKFGASAPIFCFAGHTDVVPPGDPAQWRHDPFAAEIENGVLYGRGAADMKSAIAAFAAAASRLLAKGKPNGSIAFLITGDEEGDARNGTKRVLDWLREKGERLDHCLVGEPTSVAAVGDTLKIGRRGSLNVSLTVKGVQGHVAYPQAARNPIPALAVLVAALSRLKLDEGTNEFEPSSLSFTSVDVGNKAVNVIPAEARTAFNIRFNALHTPSTLVALLKREAGAIASQTGCEIVLEPSVSGTAFLTKPGPFTDLLIKAAETVTGRAPQFSTGGGTSDARFIKDFCPVAELGLISATMHQVDECVPVADIGKLADIYAAVLHAYFSHPPT
jgi:succinyl-diaminopimelate desuccinylase